MAEYENVVIGIQARSTSIRFPRKSQALLGGRPMIEHVLEAANRAAKYINRHSHKTFIQVNVALLVPRGDELADTYRKRTIVVEGADGDVLSRYVAAMDRLNADYMVRVTGDCPLIPPYLISKHIKTALQNRYDYVSNVDADSRTACDGNDCEVMSRKMLRYLSETATDPHDREHVTALARHAPPSWARIGHVVGFLYLTDLKLSVDTPEDLERVRAQYDRIQRAIQQAEAKHGPDSIHRF